MVVVLQIVLGLDEQIEQLLLMFESLDEGFIGGEHVQVAQETGGRASWNRSDSDVAVVKKEWEDPPSDPHKRPQCRRNVALGHPDVAFRRRPVDAAGARTVFVAEHRILLTPLRPEHLVDGRLKDPRARLDRRILLEWAYAVVQQKRRRGPDADERRHARIPAAASWQRVVDVFRLRWIVLRPRIPDLDRPDCRQRLVRLR